MLWLLSFVQNNMNVKIIEFSPEYTCDAVSIWNEIIEEGVAFPQLDYLDDENGKAFFEEQSFTGLALDEDSHNIVGLYILHPNNVGRSGHIANASYAVASSCRGMGIGEILVTHCLDKAKELGFKIMQFNAVVANNQRALKLYKKLEFVLLGTIPNGFLLKDGRYEDITVHYNVL